MNIFIILSILPKDFPPKALKESFANLESLSKTTISETRITLSSSFF